MNHLEKLIRQYYEWKDYIVRGNIKVGRLPHGGWAGELDIVAYHHLTNHLVHLEPSIAANSWKDREAKFDRKFTLGRKYIHSDVLPWLNKNTPIEQIAVLITSTRKELASGRVISIDEFMKIIIADVSECGIVGKNAIAEEFDLLRTIQMTICGYYKVL